MNNVYIILVEPVYRGNIGAVSRIMHNFSFFNLRIVGKIPEKEDQIMAVHSEEIMNNAQIFPDLKSALADIDRSIVLTRRYGRKKKIDYNPIEMSDYVHHSKHLKIALVFGRETWGLTDEEASLCHLRCYIPANENFPSINLSQSVAVTLYELYAHTYRKKYREKSASKEVIDETVNYIKEVLQNIGYFKDAGTENLEQLFTSILFRANISKPVAYKLKAVFNRIHVINKNIGFGFKIKDEDKKKKKGDSHEK